MPSESSQALPSLVATGAPGTEIFVIDHAFRLVDRGLDLLTASLPPGLYKVKFRQGTALEEQYVTLEPGGGSVHVSPRDLRFSSPAPLAATRKTYETHVAAAAQASRHVHETIGAGSQLFVFTRQWSGGAQTAFPAGQHPATDLTLHDENGRLLLDLSQTGESNLSGDPWAASTVALKPGAYRLRLTAPGVTTLDQVVTTSSNWQTEVFLLQANYSNRDNPLFRADLANASVLLARPGLGFAPDDSSLRLAELARLALAEGRVVVRAEDLQQMLFGKFEHPTLGIYAAHALIADLESRFPPSNDASVSIVERAGRDSQLQLLQTVVTNLSALTPDNTDVAALSLYVSGTSSRPFATPPMLTRGWRLVADRSVTNPALVPADSLTARVAPFLWGSGPWVIWLADKVDALGAAPARLGDVNVLAALADRGPSLSGRRDLTEFERAVVAHWDHLRTMASKASKQTSGGEMPAASPTPAPDAMPGVPSGGLSTTGPSAAQLAASLRVPPATVQLTIAALEQKLFGVVELDLPARGEAEAGSTATS